MNSLYMENGIGVDVFDPNKKTRKVETCQRKATKAAELPSQARKTRRPELTDEELEGTSGGDKISPILTNFPKVELEVQFDPELDRLTQNIINPGTVGPTFKRR